MFLCGQDFAGVMLLTEGCSMLYDCLFQTCVAATGSYPRDSSNLLCGRCGVLLCSPYGLALTCSGSLLGRQCWT
jgi:hypothetical protein